MTEKSKGDYRDMNSQDPREFLLSQLSPETRKFFEGGERHLVAYGFDTGDKKFVEAMTANLEVQRKKLEAALLVDDLGKKISISDPGVQDALKAQGALDKESTDTHYGVDRAIRAKGLYYTMGASANKGKGKREDFPDSIKGYGGWTWGSEAKKGDEYDEFDFVETGAFLLGKEREGVITTVYDDNGKPQNMISATERTKKE